MGRVGHEVYAWTVLVKAIRLVMPPMKKAESVRVNMGEAP